MGRFANTAADADVQSLILGELSGRPSFSVVSTNAIVNNIVSAMPDCVLSALQLAALVTEAAMLLGLIPVFDRARLIDDCGEFGDAYGYGHRAHQPDPLACYVFRPGPPRTLPVQPRADPTIK